MTERAIVPMHELTRRIPLQGRIRMGEYVPDSKSKTGFRPVRLSRFRFTSADKEAICQIAALYGGTVKPWEKAPTPGQFQVTIKERAVNISLPPDPLGDGPIMELWSGGGCLRRCDGVEVVTNTNPEPQPCICDKNQRRECDVKTRLNVILRNVRFGGVWRLDTGSWNAAHELPGSVDLVLLVQDRGLPCGQLVVEERKQVKDGKTKLFNVPVITAGDLSIDELASGLGTVHALGTVPAPRELEAGDGRTVGEASESESGVDAPEGPEGASGAPDDDVDVVGGERAAPVVDDEIDDAEIVEEGPDIGSPAAGEQNTAPAPGPSSTLPSWQRALHAAIGDLELGDLTVDEFRHGLVLLVTDRRVSSSSGLTAIERTKAFDLLAELKLGDRRVVGVREDGMLLVSMRRDA